MRLLRHTDQVDEAAQRQAPEYVGLTEVQARERASEAGRPLRVVQRDDEHFIVTMDYQERRVNVVVQDGTVTSAECY